MLSFVRWLRFNMWYFGRPPWDTMVTPPELVEFAQQARPGAALDLGCGTGTNMAYLARLGWRVQGVDFALKAVESARRRLTAEHLPGIATVGDVTRLDGVRGPFDLVLDIGCYHSIEPEGRARYRAAIPNLLTPNGAFLIYAHLKDQPDSPVGLDEAEIASFANPLRLTWRQDSLDGRGRKAVWMRFEK